MVRDGAAEWSDSTYTQITVNQQGALRVRGLSCRVGEVLARDVRADKGYGRVMLAEILDRRRGLSSKWLLETA